MVLLDFPAEVLLCIADKLNKAKDLFALSYLTRATNSLFLPYLPFPDCWPIFTPKDKLGDWFESYVKLLDLNAWVQTTLTSSSLDDATGKWTISLERKVREKTETRVVHPKVCQQCILQFPQLTFLARNLSNWSLRRA